MVKKIGFFILCLLGLILIGSSKEVFAAGPVLQNETLSVVFNEKNGLIESMTYAGKPLLAEKQQGQGFDLSENGQWQFGKHPVELLSVKKRNGNLAVAEYRFGDWNIALQYQLDKTLPMIRRTAKLTWNGREQTKLKGFWWDWPLLITKKNSLFFGPNTYPPNRQILSEIPNGKSRSFGQATPSLIYEWDPDLSFLFINDDLWRYADSCACTGEKREKGFRISQSFNALAIMKPGQSQTVGAGYCWIIPGDGENALHKIHDWMKMTGNVIPVDRPKWFESAALYSFHPGGTIGSGCLDLGGFQASLSLLDRVKLIGMNSVWIMPIEDQGIYHPRDYYKFQNGLGSSDDYKELVQYAHRLGIHVLQDNVPHGGSNTNDRAKAHPEWLVYAEDGSTFNYWCFDFNWPSWREYIGKVVAHYVREYDIDGYRVDACSGSKTANWNPDIPYDRASFAQRQGGLNMLRTIRANAKAAKKDPDRVGILAETGGSVYGVVADAIYDFRGCYNLHHGMRNLAPAVWVQQIRRTLHEEQFSEVKDMLRLRHSESHDSLRSELWFGTEPMRALVALTAYIHGLPLIYQEQEVGNIEAFRKIFEVRARLPELQAGDADYLGVSVPDGVFACRRFKDGKESIVLINFNFKPVSFDLDLGSTARASDMFEQKQIKIDSGKTRITLKPYKYTVLALRDIDFEQNKSGIGQDKISSSQDKISSGQNKISSGQDKIGTLSIKADRTASVDSVRSNSEKTLVLQEARYRAEIDSETGLLSSFSDNGHPLIDRSILFLPLAGQKIKAVKTASDEKSCSFRLTFGKALLDLSYRAEKDGLIFEGYWSGQDLPEDAFIAFPIRNGKRWSAMTAEGYLEDHWRVRAETASSKSGNIYWRSQGSEVLFDSLMRPFEKISGVPMFLGASDGSDSGVVFELKDNPLRVRWHGKLAGQKRLAASFSFFDSESVKTNAPQAVRLKLCPEKLTDWRNRADQAFGSAPQSASWSLVPVAGGWLFENRFYSLRLKRNGAITSLVQRNTGKDSQTEIAQNGTVYTDYGFCSGEKQRMRFSSENEVETAIRLEGPFNEKTNAKVFEQNDKLIVDSSDRLKGKKIRIRFEGRLRGFGRFDNLSPAILFSYEYVLGEGPDFETECSVCYTGRGAVKSAFLSNYLVLPTVDRYVFSRDNRILADGKNLEVKDRGWQTAIENAKPDRIQFYSNGQRILTIEPNAKNSLTNIFMQRHNFFMAFCDNTGMTGEETKAFRARITVGDSLSGKPYQPVDFPTVKTKQKNESDSFLTDGDFEESSVNKLTAFNSEEQIELAGPVQSSAWVFPGSAHKTNQTVKDGKYAAELVSNDGSYFLIRQPLDPSLFEPGHKYRISCQVKADKIIQGDIGWKTGIVRICLVADGKQNYLSGESLLGSFDWKRISFEFTVPEKTKSISLEAGLNGAVGSIWFDSFKMEKVK